MNIYEMWYYVSSSRKINEVLIYTTTKTNLENVLSEASHKGTHIV